MIINTDEIEMIPDINEDNLHAMAGSLLSDFYDEGEMPDFSLSFVKPETIRELNRTYRNVDSVTDVLSFESGGETDPETGNEYLGDIIICLEQAVSQAEQSGHAAENEISLLMIHGLLHLLGYDHMTDQDKEEMWDLQNTYLDKFGIRLNRRPGEDFDF